MLGPTIKKKILRLEFRYTDTNIVQNKDNSLLTAAATEAYHSATLQRAHRAKKKQRIAHLRQEKATKTTNLSFFEASKQNLQRKTNSKQNELPDSRKRGAEWILQSCKNCT